jgi:hypothetical protein
MPWSAGDDDEGVSRAGRAFRVRRSCDRGGVRVLDLEGVVEHVVADDLRVGPVGGHAVDVAELFAAFVDAGLVFVGAVGLGAAIPEAPGFVLWFSGVEEVVEVGGVIVVAHGGRRWGLVLVEGFASDEAGLAGGVVGDARAPAFAGDAHVPAFFGEDFGPAFEFGGEHGHVVAGLFVLPGVAPGEHDGAGGGAFGDGRVGVGEQQPFFGDAVKGGCLHPSGAIGSGVRAPVIGDGEEDVRKESRVTYASDDPGKVLWVNRPELHLDCKHAAVLFRVPEMPSRLFCTRDFIDLVLKQKLTGVYFEDPKKELFGNPLPLFGTPLGMKLNPGVFKA